MNISALDLSVKPQQSPITVQQTVHRKLLKPRGRLQRQHTLQCAKKW